jgi:hypothetical protein
MGQAVDAIAMAVLPADSFDPCRDPAACPKPEPLPRPAPPSPEHLRRVASWAPWHNLILRLNPNSRDPNAGRLTNGQMVLATGRTRTEGVPQGHRNQWIQITWIEIRMSDGTLCWALESIFEKPDDRLRSEHVFDNHRTNFRGFLPASRPGSRYCAHTARLQGRLLPLNARPRESAPSIASISPTSCLLTGTGDISTDGRWLEIQHDDGPTGWAPAYFLRHAP